MKRIRTQPRDNWQATIESQGFDFHSAEGEPYWDETVHYAFTAEQVDELEAATAELHEMCLDAVEEVIENNRFGEFRIPDAVRDLVADSWRTQPDSLYGRFDFAYDGRNPPKLLEYNADTPTSLLEAAVIQWYWLQDLHPQADQFNSIHERLIDAWRRRGINEPIWFAAMSETPEDYTTVSYLRDTAMQAGLETAYIDIERIGWNTLRQRFVDAQQRHIANCFKLYPWEWMVREQFAGQLLHRNTRWIEPPWKMILSNKAILPLLWEMFPKSPYLLPASFEPLRGDHVRKPLLSREGANIDVVIHGRTQFSTPGMYADESEGGGWIYQAFCPLPDFNGMRPLIGSWVIDGHPAGIGIREAATLITGNGSRFVPHLFEP